MRRMEASLREARALRLRFSQSLAQSDAALRQSTEGRQMAAATLSVGVLLAILEAAPEIRVPFRVDSHHSSKLGGKSQGGRPDRNHPHRENSPREGNPFGSPPPHNKTRKARH